MLVNCRTRLSFPPGAAVGGLDFVPQDLSFSGQRLAQSTPSFRNSFSCESFLFNICYGMSTLVPTTLHASSLSEEFRKLSELSPPSQGLQRFIKTLALIPALSWNPLSPPRAADSATQFGLCRRALQLPLSDAESLSQTSIRIIPSVSQEPPSKWHIVHLTKLRSY